jgi:glycosyltransferase involved in cell wall biosynthesis
MKIAQISPPWFRTPSKKSGGTEFIVSTLTEQLVALGHDVTLFATGDSQTEADLWSWFAQANQSMALPDEIVHVIKAYEYIAKNNFDVIHNHTYITGPAVLSLSTIPSVSTFHLTLNQLAIDFPSFYGALSQHRFISISQRQQTVLPWFNWIGTVYHGIDLQQFPFEANKEEYLLFIGNLIPVKGPHIAIQVAKKLGCRLKIAGRKGIGGPSYFEEQIAPHIDGEFIEYVGEVGFEQKVALYQHAKALLMPITWEEAFGLVMIEALACGTPVIAFDKGSAPEIIENGKVGFLVNNVDEMAKAVQKVATISHQACRQHAEQYFTIQKMTENYLRFYQKIIANA